MFRDLFKNKAAMMIMGGALILIIALVLVFLFAGGGLASSGDGGSGSIVAFATNLGPQIPPQAPGSRPAPTDAPEETEAPEATDAPEKTDTPEATETPQTTPMPTDTPQATPAPTREPPATPGPDQGEGEIYAADRFGVYMSLLPGMTAEDNGLKGLDAAIAFYFNGVRVGGLHLIPGKASDILDDEDAFSAYLEALVASSGADGIKDAIRDTGTVYGYYPAELLFTELLVGGEHKFTVFNWFVDDMEFGRGCYVLTYVSPEPMDMEEARIVIFVYDKMLIMPPDQIDVETPVWEER